MNRVDQARVIAKVSEALESLAEVLEILLPDGDDASCPHPSDQIEHEETMDEVEQPYRCKRCGKEQVTPFHIQE